MPFAEGGRLIIVRSLSVGKFRSSEPSSSLALTIERRLREVERRAVYGESLRAESQPVVYFLDKVEPYVCLALRLARGSPTDAWFWRVAVPHWHPGMARHEALRAILTGMIETPVGVASAITLVDEMHERGALDSLLAALRPQEGAALLRAHGWAAPRANVPLTVRAISQSIEEDLSASWLDSLDRWITRWGASDERSLWLAAMSLLAQRPARVVDTRLRARAQRLIESITARPLTSTSALKQQEKHAVTPHPSPAPSVGEAPSVSSYERELISVDEAPSASSAQPVELSPQGADHKHPGRQLVEDAATIPALTSPGDSARSQPQEGDSITASPGEYVASSTVSGWQQAGGRSEHAGLFFLLAVMSRLGISQLLDSNPQLIELGLPRRFLHHVCKRLAIPVDDPALLALGDEDAFANSASRFKDQPCEFVVPWNRMEVISDPCARIIRRSGCERNARMIFDGTGRLALALWRGRATEGVREVTRGFRLTRGLPVAHAPGMGLLLTSMLIATRRWCRRYAGIGLSAVVRRPGQIRATRTHLDISFDHHQADIRIRKAGLDIDPGWIPWFERIIKFHYLYGEDFNGV
jgi:hypothetical protein